VIARAEVNRPDFALAFPPQYGARLNRTTGDQLRRRQNTFWRIYPREESLLVHSGNVRPDAAISGDPFGAIVHDHPPEKNMITLLLSMGKRCAVTFERPRRFWRAGSLWIRPVPQPISCFGHSGPEPLAMISTRRTDGALKGKKQPRIKTALLTSGSWRWLGILCPAKHFTRTASTRAARRRIVSGPVLAGWSRSPPTS